MKKLLIIDVENKTLDLMAKIFERSGVDVSKAIDAHHAAGILMRENVDVVLLDSAMPTTEGKILSKIVHTCNPDCKVIVSSNYSEEVQKESIPDAISYHQKSEGAKALFDKVVAVMV
jgi:DNA-binding NtrC family response regulator